MFSDAAALLSVALKQFLIAKEFGEAEARKLAVLRAELDHADGQIALAEEGRVLHRFRGEVAGEIVDKPRRGNGFGYDPYFL